jgi:hypothetical protein
LNCNLKRIPVVDHTNKCIGVLDRATAEKVRGHKMEEHVVGDYMDTVYASLTLNDLPAQALGKWRRGWWREVGRAVRLEG